MRFCECGYTVSGYYSAYETIIKIQIFLIKLICLASTKQIRYGNLKNQSKDILDTTPATKHEKSLAMPANLL